MREKEWVNECEHHEYVVYILKCLNKIQKGLCSSDPSDERMALINLGMLNSTIRMNLQIEEEQCKAALHEEFDS